MERMEYLIGGRVCGGRVWEGVTLECEWNVCVSGVGEGSHGALLCAGFRVTGALIREGVIRQPLRIGRPLSPTHPRLPLLLPLPLSHQAGENRLVSCKLPSMGRLSLGMPSGTANETTLGINMHAFVSSLHPTQGPS